MQATAELVQKAFELSVTSHKGQLRKGTKVPYVIHPFRVTARLMLLKANSTNLYMIMCVSMLHDIVEDTDITIDYIAKEFGLQVAAIVQELTTDPVMVEILGKVQYLSGKMIKMSSYALTIKLEDRYDNICDMTRMSGIEREKTIQETKEILINLITGRPKISSTQQRIINDIYLEMRKYETIEEE